MNLPICKLCLTNKADKMNSHIIPKFLCKGIFAEIPHRHTLRFVKGEKERKAQDSIKEDNILCTNCEKRIEVIETYFGRFFKEWENFTAFPEQYTLLDKNLLLCTKVHPILFKLFIYTIIWRLAISHSKEFKNYKISEKVVENIRDFLNAGLKNNKPQLLNSFEDLSTPLFHFCIIKPKLPENILLTAYNINNSVHLTIINAFGIIFFSDENLNNNVFVEVSNVQNKQVLISIGDNEIWQSFNQKIFQTFSDSQ
ncbi:hypothetical protein [Emticicia sp. W12TSBA100-4]|uniref:hypothetical protein n=1 Tax=Emticicia sp. W12TSBA100-4 TaxID=3160965 RepID=UPI0033066239